MKKLLIMTMFVLSLTACKTETMSILECTEGYTQIGNECVEIHVEPKLTTDDWDYSEYTSCYDGSTAETKKELTEDIFLNILEYERIETFDLNLNSDEFIGYSLTKPTCDGYDLIVSYNVRTNSGLAQVHMLKSSSEEIDTDKYNNYVENDGLLYFYNLYDNYIKFSVKIEDVIYGAYFSLFDQDILEMEEHFKNWVLTKDESTLGTIHNQDNSRIDPKDYAICLRDGKSSSNLQLDEEIFKDILEQEGILHLFSDQVTTIAKYDITVATCEHEPNAYGYGIDFNGRVDVQVFIDNELQIFDWSTLAENSPKEIYYSSVLVNPDEKLYFHHIDFEHEDNFYRLQILSSNEIEVFIDSLNNYFELLN